MRDGAFPVEPIAHECAPTGRLQGTMPLMEAAGGRLHALPCHYGCLGGAALALAIISATEAVVIG